MTLSLIRIAKTAVLCAVLGLALYVIVEAISSTSDRIAIALWLGLVFCVGLLLITAPMFHRDLRSGELQGRIGRVARESEPFWYWTLMALNGAAIGGTVTLAIYCVIRLIDN
jgi:hypothetical protein